jgi:hypothetical protein
VRIFLLVCKKLIILLMYYLFLPFIYFRYGFKIIFINPQISNSATGLAVELLIENSMKSTLDSQNRGFNLVLS